VASDRAIAQAFREMSYLVPQRTWAAIIERAAEIDATPQAPAAAPAVDANDALDALKFLAGVRVFVTSRERIKAPEGEDLFDAAIKTVRAALTTPAASGGEAVPFGYLRSDAKPYDGMELRLHGVWIVDPNRAFSNDIALYTAPQQSAQVAEGWVLAHKSDLIEEDSYGVYGSEFYRCKLCGNESGAGRLNRGIEHKEGCPLAAAPSAEGESK